MFCAKYDFNPLENPKREGDYFLSLYCIDAFKLPCIAKDFWISRRLCDWHILGEGIGVGSEPLRKSRISATQSRN